MNMNLQTELPNLLPCKALLHLYMYMKYRQKLFTAANTEIALLWIYIFLLQLVSTFDISIVEISDGLR
jgi:hypothetical protein